MTFDLSTIPGFITPTTEASHTDARADLEAFIEKVERNLVDVPYGQPINYDIADGVILTEALLPPDQEELMSRFAVGDRFEVKGDPYYEAKRLVITAVDRVGLTTIDKDEVVGNRLSKPTAHCFGWPTIVAWQEKGMI